jgi:signal transduction histidine kinase
MRVMQVHGRYAATFAERTRMSRELHDLLLQGLSGAVLRLRGLRKRLDPVAPRLSLPAAVEEMKEIESGLQTNVEETRRLVWDLRVPGGAGDLVGALSQMVAGAAGGTTEVRLRVEGRPSPLPPHPAREVVRICQQALANALTHAGGRRVEVRLRFADEEVTVEIEDDGHGFDPAEVPGEQAGHFGLTGMRERAASLGTLVVDSRPGQGTRVALTVRREDDRD